MDGWASFDFLVTFVVSLASLFFSNSLREGCGIEEESKPTEKKQWRTVLGCSLAHVVVFQTEFDVLGMGRYAERYHETSPRKIRGPRTHFATVYKFGEYLRRVSRRSLQDAAFPSSSVYGQRRRKLQRHDVERRR